MQAIAFLILFAGIFLVVDGVYQERLRSAGETTRVEYRFIPRTFYEEQLSDDTVTAKMKGMFEGESPWQGRGR